MLVHCKVTPSIKFTGTHLYTWVERDTLRVKCLSQEHNTMSKARAWTWTAWYGGEGTDGAATVSVKCIKISRDWQQHSQYVLTVYCSYSNVKGELHVSPTNIVRTGLLQWLYSFLSQFHECFLWVGKSTKVTTKSNLVGFTLLWLFHTSRLVTLNVTYCNLSRKLLKFLFYRPL